jgi:hypothetical protein
MIRQSRTLPVLVLMLVAVVALAACGGGSTPSATSAPGATPVAGSTAAPAATSAGEATAAPGATTAPAASPAEGGINLGGAAASLDNLNNYSFKIEMKAEGGSEFMMVPAGGSLVMKGDVILKPTQAVDVTMTTNDGTTASDIGYRIIGDTAYINLGGDSWMSAPADDAASAVDAFKPDQMLGSYASLQGLSKVGDEDKNGVSTEHYSSTADPGVGSMFGLPGATWTTDVWIAKDGGYVVSASMTATGKNATGDQGTFVLTVDVTGANDPNMVIEAPKNLTELPG